MPTQSINGHFGKGGNRCERKRCVPGPNAASVMPSNARNINMYHQFVASPSILPFSQISILKFYDRLMSNQVVWAHACLQKTPT